MDIDLSHTFDTHEQARHAAAALEAAGIPPDGISLIDGHRDGGGGTMLTVRATPEQVQAAGAVLAGYGTNANGSKPGHDTRPLTEGAPAYVAGGTANLGTPGPD